MYPEGPKYRCYNWLTIEHINFKTSNTKNIKHINFRFNESY